MALRAPAPTEEESVGTLVQRLGTDVTRIVRAEVRLVQLRGSEAVRVAKTAGIGVVLAAVFGLVGFWVVIAGVVMIVATLMRPWYAAFAVGGGLLVIAAILLAVELRVLNRGVTEVLAPIDGRDHGE